MAKDRQITTDNMVRLTNHMAITKARGGIFLGKGLQGRGKTTAAKHFAATDPDALLLEIDRASKTFGGFLTLAIKNAELYVRNSGRNADKAEVLKSYLEDHRRFLIIDEAQQLDLDALRYAISFNDHFKTPIAILGNEQLLRRTRAHAAAFDQIEDRITARMEILGPSANDVQNFCIEFNVAREAYARMIAWGQKTTFRAISDVLALASDLVERGPITADDIANAIQSRHGPQTASDFMLRARAA